MKYLNILSQIENLESQLDIPKTGTPDGTTVSTVTNIVFIIFGAVAVIVIIWSGIQFMMSQGDPAKTVTARNTIIYAVIGLALTVLAFSIVSFVIGKV